MTIKRQDQIEQYNITADWLQDFARALEKKSYNAENLNTIKSIFDKGKKFLTIEEKMADIKSRIGFDIIKEMRDESADNTKTAAQDCACKSKEDDCKCTIKVASSDFSESDINAMSNILKYIKDLITHEHEVLTPIMVLARCREEPGLRFDYLPINVEKLKEYIEKELSQYKSEEEIARYIPKDKFSETTDNHPEAEYWSHAFPQK